MLQLMRSFPLGAAVTLEQLELDPYPVLARLREHEPVTWIEVLDSWLVTRHDLVLQVMRDAATYTVDDPRFSTAHTDQRGIGDDAPTTATTRRDPEWR